MPNKDNKSKPNKPKGNKVNQMKGVAKQAAKLATGLGMLSGRTIVLPESLGALGKRAGEYLIDRAVDSINVRATGGTVPPMEVKPTSTYSGGGGSSSGSSSSSGGGGGGGSISFNKTAMEPERSRIELNSDVPPGILAETYPDASRSYSPVYISHGLILGEVNNNDRVWEDITEVIWGNVETEMTNSLNYKLDTSVNQTSFVSWFNSISYALQLHYTIDSILAYTTGSPNENFGMNSLRDLITADTMLKWNRLDELLNKEAVPKPFLNFIRYMYQNFSFSEVPGAPIMRLSCDDTFLSGSDTKFDSNLNSNLDKAIAALTLPGNKRVSDYMQKTFPNLIIGQLPPSTTMAMVSHDFHTFWRNQSYYAWDSGFTTQPLLSRAPVLNDDSPVEYGICENELDGLMVAMFNQQINLAYCPGIWKPSPEWVNVVTSGGQPLYERQRASTITRMRIPSERTPTSSLWNEIDHTMDPTNSGITTCLSRNTDLGVTSSTLHSPMAQNCNTMTLNLQKQSVYRSVRTLLDFGRGTNMAFKKTTGMKS